MGSLVSVVPLTSRSGTILKAEQDWSPQMLLILSGMLPGDRWRTRKDTITYVLVGRTLGMNIYVATRLGIS